MHRLLYPWRADGTPRVHRNSAPKPRIPAQRSKRANGKLAISGNSARGRRLRELIRIYSEGLDPEDEKAAALVRSTASVALKAEQLEDALDAGEPVDEAALARLIRLRENNLSRLAAKKAEASPPEAEVEGAAALKRLRTFLAKLAAKG
jgi:hypothetical protein